MSDDMMGTATPQTPQTPDALMAPLAPDDPQQLPEERRARIVAETLRKKREWEELRRPHEGTWFVTGAMLRGQQHVEYDSIEGRLVKPDTASYAITLDLNKMRPKHRARMSKFLKNRPKPVVVPPSTDYQDLMDARATARVLDYQADRLRLEQKYRDARLWASVCYRGYWWLGYDDSVVGRVKVTDPMTGQERTVEAPLGDMTLDVSNSWEVLVPDMTLSHIGQQPEIMRVRSLPMAEAKRRFPTADEALLAGDKEQREYEERLSSLRAGPHVAGARQRKPDAVVLIEHFTAPCAKHPKGRKVTIAGSALVRYIEELPFEFWDSPTNPYPCVEFTDGDSPGQFYGTTWLEQLVPLQRVLNRTFELILENAEACSRPKIVVYKQHNMAEGAWTSLAGEIVELNWVPGLPTPQIVQPANVAADLWNVINLVLRQFDDISQIPTASEGGAGGQESGYQTSLLQEATDAVHAPDIRADELAIEDWAWKARRIMKLTWDVPRLVSVGGERSLGEMLEFSQRQINDHAEVRIQIGSMLPDLKAAKAQVVLEYYKAGLLGDPADPQVRHKALSMLNETGYDVLHAKDRIDQDLAQRENALMRTGQGVEPAQWHHDHLVHISEHEAEMKSPEWQAQPNAQKLVYISHLITHYDFTNPPLAMGLRQQFGVPMLPIATPPPPPAPAPQMQAPPSGTPAAPTPQAAPLPA